VWRAGTAAQNWGKAPAPQAQCATPLGLSLSEGLGVTALGQMEYIFVFAGYLRRTTGRPMTVEIRAAMIEASVLSVI
jgi:hypothetical protein